MVRANYIYMHLSHLPTWSCENISTMKIIMDFFFFFGYKSGIFNQIKTQVPEPRLT